MIIVDSWEQNPGMMSLVLGYLGQILATLDSY